MMFNFLTAVVAEAGPRTVTVALAGSLAVNVVLCIILLLRR
jgi:hypothetical protein